MYYSRLMPSFKLEYILDQLQLGQTTGASNHFRVPSQTYAGIRHSSSAAEVLSTGTANPYNNHGHHKIKKNSKNHPIVFKVQVSPVPTELSIRQCCCRHKTQAGSRTKQGNAVTTNDEPKKSVMH
jgi:hypothetical protein